MTSSHPMTTTAKPRVLYLPNKIHTARVFSPATFARLLERFDVTQLAGDSCLDCTSAEVAQAIPGFDALVTGWGTPALTPEVFERASDLRLIAHSAGSVKAMLGRCAVEHVMPRGICMFSANRAIAYNAAEHTLGLMIAMCRKLSEQAQALRRNPGIWPDRMVRHNAQFLTGSRVGLVSASEVGRQVIRLLKPFDVELRVFDPFLTFDEALGLGVEKVDLMTVFEQSDIVSVHAPLLPATRGLIGRAHFAAMRDGAVFINTSRGAILDESALVCELGSGRFSAALDVTIEEPLPADSPLLTLENVLVTPHLAGSGHYGYSRIGEGTVNALEDFFAGRSVTGAIDFHRYDIIA